MLKIRKHRVSENALVRTNRHISWAAEFGGRRMLHCATPRREWYWYWHKVPIRNGRVHSPAMACHGGATWSKNRQRRICRLGTVCPLVLTTMRSVYFRLARAFGAFWIRLPYFCRRFSGTFILSRGWLFLGSSHCFIDPPRLLFQSSRNYRPKMESRGDWRSF